MWRSARIVLTLLTVLAVFAGWCWSRGLVTVVNATDKPIHAAVTVPGGSADLGEIAPGRSRTVWLPVRGDDVRVGYSGEHLGSCGAGGDLESPRFYRIRFTVNGSHLFASPPALPPGSIKSVEVERLIRRDEHTATESVASEDAIKTHALAALVEQGKPVPYHKCGPRAYLRFRLHSGQMVEMWLFPGHSESHYEYRYPAQGLGNMFRVDRAAFLKAMSDIGVTGLDTQ